MVFQFMWDPDARIATYRTPHIAPPLSPQLTPGFKSTGGLVSDDRIPDQSHCKNLRCRSSCDVTEIQRKSRDSPVVVDRTEIGIGGVCQVTCGDKIYPNFLGCDLPGEWNVWDLKRGIQLQIRERNKDGMYTRRFISKVLWTILWHVRVFREWLEVGSIHDMIN